MSVGHERSINMGDPFFVFGSSPTASRRKNPQVLAVNQNVSVPALHRERQVVAVGNYFSLSRRFALKQIHVRISSGLEYLLFNSRAAKNSPPNNRNARGVGSGICCNTTLSRYAV
jgi:hypothetical protein